MTTNEYYTYIAILLILIFFLSIGVSFYYLKYKRILKSREDRARQYLEKEAKRVEHVNDSLRIIALAFKQGQCELSEACIRLRMLIDRVDHIENSKFPYLFEMYEKIKHFKTHEARNALSSKERFNEDKIRFKIEKEFEQEISKECDALLSMLKSFV